MRRTARTDEACMWSRGFNKIQLTKQILWEKNEQMGHPEMHVPYIFVFLDGFWTFQCWTAGTSEAKSWLMSHDFVPRSTNKRRTCSKVLSWNRTEPWRRDKDCWTSFTDCCSWVKPSSCSQIRFMAPPMVFVCTNGSSFLSLGLHGLAEPPKLKLWRG